MPIARTLWSVAAPALSGESRTWSRSTSNAFHTRTEIAGQLLEGVLLRGRGRKCGYLRRMCSEVRSPRKLGLGVGSGPCLSAP